jgi:alpha-ribazole phosphatase CobZ
MNSSNNSSKKKDEPTSNTQRAATSIRELLEERGVSEDVLVSTAMELYVPHPGIETRKKAERVFKEELALALSDPNLCLLLYAALLLEDAGMRGELPDLPSASYERDLTYLIVDEVLGMTIALYIAGHKGSFEYVRFDKKKPGILGELGPFMDDAVAGLIGGVSSNMYTRGMKQ